MGQAKNRLPRRATRPPAVPESSMLPLWRRIYQAFTTRGQRWDLPANAGMVLVHLHVHTEGCEPARLAEYTRFPRQTMTFVLDTLEKRGLAVRTPHASDRRRVRIELTPSGRTLAARMLKDLLAFEAAALAAIPDGDHGLFQRLVGCYADALEQQYATPEAIKV